MEPNYVPRTGLLLLPAIGVSLAVCSIAGCGVPSGDGPRLPAQPEPRRFIVTDSVPRTAEGQTDLSGIWVAAGALALIEGPDALREALAADEAAGYEEPETRPPPYTPEAEAIRKKYLDRQDLDDAMAQCVLTGVPRINFRPQPFEIVQLPELVIVLYDIHHAYRVIPTDGRERPKYIEPTYLGESAAFWDGDTLVVDVIGFNDQTWLAGTGTWHSDELRVTERWTRISYDTLAYEAIVEDPVVFTRPWRLYETFRLRPNERLRESQCIESNEELVRFQ